MNPVMLASLEEFEPRNEAERMELERAWFDEERAMWRDGEHILRLVSWRRAEILALAGPNASDAALVRATKQFIVMVKSVDIAEENRAQAKQMKKEQWYRGVRTPEEAKLVKDNWVRDHGPGWRRWRVVEYLYVADRCARQIADALRQPVP